MTTAISHSPILHIASSATATTFVGVKKVMGAYTDEKSFSVDLVAAVLRQDAFNEKLYHLGWLNSEFFDTDEYQRFSNHCIFRYQGFLSLILQKQKLVRRFSVMSRRGSTPVHGNHCSVSAQPSVHLWVGVHGTGPSTNLIAATEGTVEKQRKKQSYDRRNAALLVPGPLYY